MAEYLEKYPEYHEKYGCVSEFLHLIDHDGTALLRKKYRRLGCKIFTLNWW